MVNRLSERRPHCHEHTLFYAASCRFDEAFGLHSSNPSAKPKWFYAEQELAQRPGKLTALRRTWDEVAGPSPVID